MLAWLETNTERGVGGSDGGFSSGVVDAATNGTLRTFTETLLKAAQASAFTAGGKPTMLFMDGPLKQTFSGFAGISATRVNTTTDATAQTSIVGAADVYVGDFGTLTAVPHPYGMTARDVIGVDPNMVAKSILRAMASSVLAKTGDADKRLINEEYTLEVKNEAAHFVVADVEVA
jgi:phage gpG-like protein